MPEFNPLCTHIWNASVATTPQHRSINWPIYIIVFALGFAVAHISF